MIDGVVLLVAPFVLPIFIVLTGVFAYRMVRRIYLTWWPDRW